MDNQSDWLGPVRQPMKWAMYISTALTVLMMAWLIFASAYLASDIGFYEMVRPGGRPQVQIMLILLLVSMVTASLYLSDTKGTIEMERSGFFDIVSLFFSRMAMISIIIVVCVMLFEVVSRYVFNKPTLWANELSLWIAGFVFLLAGLYAMQQRSHIRIYVIYDMMPRWMQKASDVLSVVLIWVFYISLVWGAFNEAKKQIINMETFGTAWDPPLPSTIKVGILVVIGLVALQALSNLIADWNKAPEHHSPADEIDEAEIEIIRKSVE